MNIRIRFFLLIIGIIILWKIFRYYELYPKNNEIIVKNEPVLEQVQENIPEKVKVTVYYESLCSDSRSFILKHLLPTYSVLSNYIILDLVPYGKAKTIEIGDEISFTCQHTSTECLGNKIHACTIDLIPDPTLQLKMVACMINDGLMPYEIAEKCANENAIDYDALLSCTNNKRSSLLLKDYGIRTNNVQPSITFIPTIELNGAQNVPLPRILKNFKSELCKVYKHTPEECL